jgi:hypothetical protein
MAAVAVAWALGPAAAFAHGFAGQRFFPATLATEDPFVADELSLPTYSSVKTPASDDEPAGREQSFEIEWAKRITPHLGISFGEEYARVSPEGEPAESGWGNLEVGLHYLLYESDAREGLLSVGLDSEIGGTGKKDFEADDFNTFTPAVFFGRGLGDLPEGAAWLRPLALTGSVGVAFPARASTTSVDEDSGNAASEIERHSDTLELGLALEYSLPYLQSAVKDVGLPAPFDRLFPVIEFSLERQFQHGGEPTEANLYPGVLWAGRSIQLGLEAIVPLNSDSGRGTGVLAQLHFFMDDLFPKTLGRPLIGGSP